MCMAKHWHLPGKFLDSGHPGVRKTLETPVTRAISDARQIQINLPRLVIFDLDATLWEPEMYQLRSAPSAWDPQSGGVQAGSQLVKLYPEAKVSASTKSPSCCAARILTHGLNLRA